MIHRYKTNKQIKTYKNKHKKIKLLYFRYYLNKTKHYNIIFLSL